MVTVCGINHPLATQTYVTCQQLATPATVDVDANQCLPRQRAGQPTGVACRQFLRDGRMAVRDLGWAWLPRHVVQYSAYQGLMVELDSEWTPPALVVELVWRRDEPLGPAARWLAERFAALARDRRKVDKLRRHE